MSGPDREGYTLGWICAITEELAAARAFLDEIYDRVVPQAPHDDNKYMLGRIGDHDIAIAGLPLHHTGTSPATHVATNMSRTFPNLRFGLMVGIGGGAPTRHNDIRLGDVVVSAVQGERGAVFQYDFGKAIQGEPFRPTKHLNAPPTLLTACVQSLRARHEIEGNDIDQSVEDALSSHPRMRKKYGRPNAVTDRLFKADFVHPVGNDCSETCNTDQTNLQSRDQRPEEEAGTQIHYGLIASANQVVKDAKMRDRLARESGVMCFEMEAAGLMNNFPCLVIRGISDYSDSHKDDRWQGYAAMAAAAYARSLLHEVPPEQVQHIQKLRETLSANQVRVASQNVEKILDVVVDSHRLSVSEQVLRFLEAPDHLTTHNEARARHHEGTNQWFLGSAEFQGWKDEPGSFIWLNGISGSGKTILISSVIAHLQHDHEANVLFFYFDFREQSKRQLTGVVRSLVAQFYRTTPECRECLDSAVLKYGIGEPATELANEPANETTLPSANEPRAKMIIQQTTKHTTRPITEPTGQTKSDSSNKVRTKTIVRQETKPTIAETTGFTTAALYDHLHAMLRLARDAWIVLDGLDEFGHERSVGADELLEWIKDICEANPEARVMVASQPEKGIPTFFKDWARTGRVHVKNFISLANEETSSDIAAYSRFKVRGMKRWKGHPEVQSQITTTIVGKAKNMFRYASCQLDEIEHCTDLDQLEQALDNLPGSLFEVYQRILNKIPSEKRAKTIRLIQFIIYSPQQLLLAEAVDLLAVNPAKDQGSRFSPSRRMPDPERDITSYCPSFIVLAQGKTRSGTCLQIAHVSVQDFFLRSRRDGADGTCTLIERDLARTPSMTAMTDICLFYLMDLDLNLLFRKGPPAYPFAMFAETNWMTFAAFVERLLRLTPDSVKSYLLSPALDSIAQALKQCGRSLEHVLKQLAFHGLLYACRVLIARGARVDATNACHCRMPHHPWETTRNPTEVVNRPNSTGYKRSLPVTVLDGSWQPKSALGIASFLGHERLVQKMVQHLADVNMEDGEALRCAVQGDHMNVVQLLLSKGANVHAQENQALRVAARNGQRHIVKILLSRGADVHHCEDEALRRASAQGHSGIAIMLLSKGADVHARRGEALRGAALQGHVEVINILLSSGADIHALEDNSLQCAAACGHAAAVKTLLSKGAYVHANDDGALWEASLHGSSETAELLLAHGADVSAGRFRSLRAAVESGHSQTVKSLLKHCAASGVGWTTRVLQAFCSSRIEKSGCRRRRLRFVRHALTHGGADMHVEIEGRNAFQWALHRRFDDLVILFMENGFRMGSLKKGEEERVEEIQRRWKHLSNHPRWSSSIA